MSGVGPLVAYDFLEARGGAERVAVMLAEALGGRLVVGFDAAAAPLPAALAADALVLGPRPATPYRRALAVLARFSRMRCPPAPAAIVSGLHAAFALPRLSRQMRTVYYCHTPPRFCFEDFDAYFGALDPLRRRAARAGCAVYAAGYRHGLCAAHRVLANSIHTRDRLRTHCGIESEVVYPPSMDVLVAPAEARSFHLSCARHEPYKRVDCIIEAFRGLPGQSLVVASTGSQTARLQRLATGASNIRFVGAVDDVELSRLLGRALSVLYLPRGEDFGMSAVEAMRHGTPVIAADEGGLRESIVHGRTGWRIQPGVEAVRAAVLQATADAQRAMAADCRRRAAMFESAPFLAAVAAAAGLPSPR